MARQTTFRLTAGQPCRIDLTTVYEGQSRALTTKGVYAFQGEELTYCIRNPDEPRPAELATRRGAGRTLVRLRRAGSGAGAALGQIRTYTITGSGEQISSGLLSTTWPGWNYTIAGPGEEAGSDAEAGRLLGQPK